MPALVRPVEGVDGVDFEVIYGGAALLWCVRYLRARGHAHIEYRVEVRRGLEDREAFRMCDEENRMRKDVSAFERGAGVCVCGQGALRGERAGVRG